MSDAAPVEPIPIASWPFERIGERRWRFGREGGPVLSEVLRLLPDGGVGGPALAEAAHWSIERGVLCLLDGDRAVSVRFERAALRDGRLVLRGRAEADPGATFVLREQDARDTSYSLTREALAREIATRGWRVGAHTYGVPDFIEPEMARFTVGRYTSIAHDVRVALGNHRVDTFTTYPFTTLRRFWPTAPTDVADHATRGDVEIGSDVWIGAGAFIGSGVRIGDGAVVGAATVVVRDVPPYAIVVGNPARVVRHRFAPDAVAELLRLRWWDLADEAVDRLLPLLLGDDHDAFFAALGRARGEHGEEHPCDS